MFLKKCVNIKILRKQYYKKLIINNLTLLKLGVIIIRPIPLIWPALREFW